MDGAGKRDPLSRGVALPRQRDVLHAHLPGLFERGMRVPQRATDFAFEQERSTRPDQAFGKLPRPVEPGHEERQPPLTDPLEGGEAVRELFEAYPKAALEHCGIVVGRFACAQEPAVRHHHSRGEVPGKVAFEQAPRGTVGKPGALAQSTDRVALFKQCELHRDLEIARCWIEHLGQLQLARVEIEPAERIGHDVARKDAQAQLVALAQAFGERAADVATGEAQFVRQRLGCDIEIGEMVAPAFHFAPRQQKRVGGRDSHDLAAHAVEQSCECHRSLRRGSEPFGNLVAIDRKIGEAFVGQPPAHSVDTADRLVPGQRAWIEIEVLGERDEQPCRKRALVTLDQIEIAGRNSQPCGHRRLRQALLAAEASQRRSGKESAIGHGVALSSNLQHDKRLCRNGRITTTFLSIFATNSPVVQVWGANDFRPEPTMTYSTDISQTQDLIQQYNGTWSGISAESVARMRAQNRFRTGLDIARYTAKVMRADMAAYDADPANYTQSLGCWHGFIAQQKMISIKKHFGSTKRRYLYLSGWMVAALRSDFGPLPDQSMHEKTSVPALIEELYTFLKQADARELGMLFRDLDAARDAGDAVTAKALQAKIDNYETHVVPVIADIDAGFGNAEATYLLAKKMIEAGACALQIENQVSDEKQCGHQDGKVTVPHDDFLAKVRACRYAFLELGIEDGIIVTRTDSLGAGLTKQIAFSKEPGDIGDQYNAFLDCEEISDISQANGDVIINRGGKLLRPKRLPSNLFQFREGTGADRCVLDCINSLQNGADLLWIETEKPHIEQIASMVDRIREVVPNAKLVYNNSPSFNWTLNFRQQVYDAWAEAGEDVSAYDRPKLMSASYDGTALGDEADERIRTFQRDAAARAGIFHHLITLPTYHTAALSTDNLAKEYFGDAGMLGYVKGVQREEIRQGIACVKHQNMSGSDIGDDHKEYFAGEAALKAGGSHNTMNQFAA